MKYEKQQNGYVTILCRSLQKQQPKYADYDRLKGPSRENINNKISEAQYR